MAYEAKTKTNENKLLVLVLLTLDCLVFDFRVVCTNKDHVNPRINVLLTSIPLHMLMKNC